MHLEEGGTVSGQHKVVTSPEPSVGTWVSTQSADSASLNKHGATTAGTHGDPAA